jgi:DNA polymerase-3 subunit delta'
MQLFVGPGVLRTLPMAILCTIHYLQYQTGENSDVNAACNINEKMHPDCIYLPKVYDVKKMLRFYYGMEFIEKNRTGLFDWYQVLDVKNKQGEIQVDDAQEILKSLALKSF